MSWMLLWAWDRATISMGLPHCLCESVPWTSDEACVVSLKDWSELRQYFVPVKNFFVFLPIWLNFLYFGRITPVFFVFLFFLQCSCHLSEKNSGHKFSNGRRPNEIIVLLHCQLVHLSVGAYVKSIDLILICLWVGIYTMYICTMTFLKSKVRYAVNFLYFHYQIRNFRHRKKIVEG